MKSIDESFKKLGFNYDEVLLKEEYREALKNKTFKSLIEELNINESKVIKMTSTLLESSNEIDNCSKCPSIFNCKNKLKGYCYRPTILKEDIFFNYEACKYQKELEKNTKYQDNIYLFDVPKEIKEAKMSDIYVEDKNRLPIIKWLKEFMNNYDKIEVKKGLYLNGSFGSGKTYLIAAMFNEMAKKGIKVAIIYFPEFLRDLKSSFESDFEAKYDYIKTVPLLLIDDIGAENLTPWGRDEILGTILQYRMQEGKPTFFTSNLNMSELEQHFSLTKNGVEEVKARRIIERIKQLTDSLELVGKNLRK